MSSATKNLSQIEKWKLTLKEPRSPQIIYGLKTSIAQEVRADRRKAPHSKHEQHYQNFSWIEEQGLILEAFQSSQIIYGPKILAGQEARANP